jgi:exopolyphosphatase/guanosine-5'-triphosphate,3'-diphosphate pyrophosphatase
VRRRVAAIDCGTNSIRLLIADVDPEAATLADVDRRMEIVRLGEGVDRTGRLDPQALRRTLDATARYGELCRAAGVRSTRFVATSATRDAANRDLFVVGVRELLGVEPEVISGDVEARLSFDGATRGLRSSSVADRADPSVLVVDIGGGSTEFVLGNRTRGVEAAVSVDIGCVRLTERHRGVLVEAEDDVRSALDHAAGQVPWHRADALVGLAGSVTTVTANALALDRYDSARIHGAALPVPDVVRSCADLESMTREQRAALPFMHPGRVDVIGAGALVWRRIIERVCGDAGLTEVLTSEHDILDGIAWSLA